MSKSSFIRVASNAELDKIIKAAEASNKMKAALAQRDVQQQVQWMDEAKIMNRQQQPTIQALKEADKTIQNLAEQQAKETVAMTTELAKLPGDLSRALPPPPAPPLPGPKGAAVVPRVAALGPIKGGVFRRDYPNVSFSSFMPVPGANAGYLGDEGSFVVFEEKDGKHYAHAHRLNTDETQSDATFEVSPLLEALLKDTGQGSKKDVGARVGGKPSADDKVTFAEIMKFVNFGKDVPNADQKGKFIGKGLEEIEIAVDSKQPFITTPEGKRGCRHASISHNANGRVFIDREHWAKGRFTVRKKGKDGKLRPVVSQKYDHTFPKLLTKKNSKNVEYTGETIDLYRRFVNGTGLEISPKSAKHKLVHGPQSDPEALKLYRESMAAGNKSTDTYNSCIALADKLYRERK